MVKTGKYLFCEKSDHLHKSNPPRPNLHIAKYLMTKNVKNFLLKAKTVHKFLKKKCNFVDSSWKWIGSRLLGESMAIRIWRLGGNGKRSSGFKLHDMTARLRVENFRQGYQALTKKC